MDRKYSDTEKGAREAFRDMAAHGCVRFFKDATWFPDPQVYGVWAAKKKGYTLIVYLAGYAGAMGTIREHNDFETDF